MNYFEKSLEFHRKNKGKLEVISKMKINNIENLSILYTPGIAEPCRVIYKNKKEVYNLTSSKNMVAVVTDGSSVLGLGNIGPEASLPVMEGKAILFNEFAGVQAFPIALQTQNVDEIVNIIKNLAPTFGGINLEDISAPRCFEIEERLKKELDIPIFHDDQHGTAIVLLAGLINSLKIVNKKKENVTVVINGSGAAGIAISKLLNLYNIGNIIICDSKGIISKKRENLNQYKKELLKFSNKKNISGKLEDALINSDVFVGVSKGNLLKAKDIKTMNKDAIIFAMANPEPEISPEEAILGGAKIIATGRSDYPNQLNNVLVFPGIFKGALKAKCQITNEMKIETAKALAKLVKNPNKNKIIPNPFEKEIVEVISKTIIDLA